MSNSNATIALTFSSDYLITNEKLGKVPLGMQVKEIKKLCPGSKFKIVSGTLDGVSSDIEVSQNGDRLFFFTANGFSEVEEVELPKDNEKIGLLMTDDPIFETVEGINVDKTFGEAEKVYGKPTFNHDANYVFITFNNSVAKQFNFYSIDNGKNPNQTYSPDSMITHIVIATK